MRASLPVTRRIRPPSPVMALLLVLGSALLPASGPAQEQRPTEIRVTARQPGPPLWRVTHGENTLWILPLVSAIPRGLHWDTTRLERILSESEEFIHAPDVDLDISKLVLLNPVNWVRGYRLAKRLGEHPEGKTLEESLPPRSMHATPPSATALWRWSTPSPRTRSCSVSPTRWSVSNATSGT